MDIKKTDWKEGLSEEQIIDGFIEEFYHDLENWFSADLCCCDNCLKELEKKWPGVHVCTKNFERQQIDLNSFYKGSFLQDDFSIEEFNKYIKNILCPKCKMPLSEDIVIYPYNFEFSIEEYENIISSIFESLNNNINIDNCTFITKLISEMKNQFKSLIPSKIDKNLYRARVYKTNENCYSKDYFKYPPLEYVNEGRYNRKGEQVLYLGDSIETCYRELRKPKKGIVVACCTIESPLKILDLTDYSNSEILRVLAYSSLSCHEQSDKDIIKKHYMFNHFFVDYARKIGFDGIKYFSTQRPNYFNIVLINPQKIWDSISILKIEEYLTE